MADDDVYDDLESMLLHEDMCVGGRSGGGGAGGGKLNLSCRAQNDITRSEKKSEKRPNYYGRDDRATSEQVLDPRTRMILFKLMNRGFLQEIDGCLSTGKEANVYYARGEDMEFAVKIFKTSILVFKDRDRYVSGEYRFRHGYCKSNPRKMVRTWAEKEMRNLKRLCAAGVPCPVPHLLKSHVLVMDFLGKDGWCAPRLKDASLSLDQYKQAYESVVLNMRKMYIECNLVHGDLSEYNLLWHDEQVVFIDVSQSVEHAHPFANDFLRKDVQNVTDFFGRCGVTTLSNYHLFQFVTLNDLKSQGGDADVASVTSDAEVSFELAHLRAWLLRDGYLQEDHETEEKQIDEAVFLQAYIPSSLGEFSAPHLEKARLEAGQREAVVEAAVKRMLALEPEESNKEQTLQHENSEEENDGEDEEGEEDSDSDDDGSVSTIYYSSDSDDGTYRRRLPPREKPEKRDAAKAARKEAKKAAKAAAAEKRTKKVPKHIKKRAVKNGRSKK